MAIAPATLLTGKAQGDLCCWESSPASGCICPCKQLTSSPMALPGKHGLEQRRCQLRAAPQLSALSPCTGEGDPWASGCWHRSLLHPAGHRLAQQRDPCLLPLGLGRVGGCTRGMLRGHSWPARTGLCREPLGCAPCAAGGAGLPRTGRCSACQCWGIAAQAPIPPLRGLVPLLSRMLCPQPPGAMSPVQPRALRPRSAAAFLLHRPAPAPQPPWLAARMPGRGASSLPPATAHAVTLQMSEP